MQWGQDFLTGFFGAQGLKDYAHASKTFRTNGYELAPRNKFLFHVYFNLNTAEIPTLKNIFSSSEQAELGLLIKTIQLPTYSLDTETLNQYNRKRIIQKRINYLPVSMTFHDDGGDLSRNLWYNYYSYYYKDPNQQYGSASNQNGSIGQVANQPGFSYNSRDIYANNRPVNDWGYIGEGYSQSNAGGPGVGSGGDQSSGKPPFFRDITIYGMDQHKWASYVLINPLIKEWKHDQYNYSEGGGIMENSMTVEYETVKYYAGAIGGSRADTNVKGFADPAHYDNIRSSLARPGSTRTVLGQGGLLDAGIGIVRDLQSGNLTGVIGAIQKAGTTYNTFKGVNIRSVVNEEANASVKAVIRNSIPGAVRQQQGGTGGFVFPRSPGYGQ
ncbi:MAG: hypothetical protein EBU08_14865 [Micrococcales bacterium]|nr:hypothetical protein [Micrococcales bacterium]